MDMYTHQSMPPRPQQDMPYDLRPRSLQWDEVMDSDSNCTMSPATSSSLQFPAVHMPAPQDLFLLSPQATAAYQDSPVELGGYPDVNATSNPNRRQSQNREAQRRFRERREQERIQLRKKMEELRAENDGLSRLLAEAKNANLKLEVDNERLTKELETLRRRWQDVLRLMADMVQQEETGEGGSPSSCSSGMSSSSSLSSRKEVQGLRSSIMMQMLVLLFDEKGESPSRTVMARLGRCRGILSLQVGHSSGSSQNISLALNLAATDFGKVGGGGESLARLQNEGWSTYQAKEHDQGLVVCSSGVDFRVRSFQRLRKIPLIPVHLKLEHRDPDSITRDIIDENGTVIRQETLVPIRDEEGKITGYKQEKQETKDEPEEEYEESFDLDWDTVGISKSDMHAEQECERQGVEKENAIREEFFRRKNELEEESEIDRRKLRGLLAMTPRGGKPQPILFVDGPSLGRGGDAKSRNTRSALIRRRISEKRSTYRQEEEAKREQLIAERQTRDRQLAHQGCTCRTVRDQDQALAHGSFEHQTTGTRTSATVPQTQTQTQNSISDGTLFRICGTCGGVRVSNPAQGSTSPALSLSIVSSRVDPFSPVDANVGPSVDDLLHHAFMNLWPNFRRADYAGRCYQSRLAPNWENNILIYTTLWAASCHRDVLRISYGSNPVLDTRDQLYYKGRLLRLLRDHVADYTNEEWRDGVILAILHLAVNETTRRDLSRDPSPFTPPFVNMQSLSFYGSRDYHSMHWNVICHLLRQLGGIQTVKLFALGWLITIADLMKAAHALTKPLFPRVDVEGNEINLPSPLRVFPLPDDSSTTKNVGFRYLLSVCPPVQGPIVDVFLHLCEYSTLVQWYYNRHLDRSDCDSFADVRNQVHHAIFSLPDEQDPVESVLDMRDLSPDDFSVSHGLYLTCRLAANLYATHVTFPLPRSALIRAMILPLLASKLDQMTQVECSPLLLWCATVAAIAAEEMPEHPRLVEHVETLCRRLSVTSYPLFVGILETFAWVEVACSEGCRRLWERLAVQSAEGMALELYRR
ncbi:hypothetical protein CNMCM6936_008789 [Aspergillus lentulus]|nr:hypothetical protein CNMCM6936_008789 [Aspergillus lentulus]